MPAPVDLYDNAYSHYGEALYRDIRTETYGEDLGQTSWVTNEESSEIPKLLEIDSHSYGLEIGCGSGRYALQVAATAGCRILALDINQPGIDTANHLAATRNMSGQVSFQQCDAAKPLPFPDNSFDATFSNDAIVHIHDRLTVFRGILRTLRPGGRFLFSDALVIGGMISHQEIATRSSIGYYLFSPPGENERILTQAGFQILEARDTTESAALISQRWHDAREKRRDALVSIEGEPNFDGLQAFLSAVHNLTSERRLRRYLYLAKKPS